MLNLHSKIDNKIDSSDAPLKRGARNFMQFYHKTMLFHFKLVIAQQQWVKYLSSRLE